MAQAKFEVIRCGPSSRDHAVLEEVISLLLHVVSLFY